MAASDNNTFSKKIEPVAPIFASIFAMKARSLFKKMVKIVPLKGADGDAGWVNTWKELKMGPGPVDDNLEERSIDAGTIGLVVGILKEFPTMCRVLVTMNHPEKDGIYLVDASRLDPILTAEQAAQTPGNKVQDY